MTSFANAVLSPPASESNLCYTRSEVRQSRPHQHQHPQLAAHPYDLQLLVFVEEQLLQVGHFHHRLILDLQQLLGHLREKPNREGRWWIKESIRRLPLPPQPRAPSRNLSVTLLRDDAAGA